jgi:hypothetical protein
MNKKKEWDGKKRGQVHPAFHNASKFSTQNLDYIYTGNIPTIQAEENCMFST